MTKLEYIQSKNSKDRRDLWDVLGKSEITPNTKYFVQDMIYRLNLGHQALRDGCLVFCKKAYSPKKILDWDSFKNINYDPIKRTGETTFGKSIIDPHFELIMFKEELDALNENAKDPEYKITIIPFEVEGEGEAGGQVKISEKDYENCLKCLGYPFISEDELEYNRDEIINLAIKPALEEYFHWLPFERIEEIPVSGTTQDIEVPADAYDVLGVSVQQRGSQGAGTITNPLLRYFDEAAYGSFNFANLTGNYRGQGRAHTVSSPIDNYFASRAISQATINLNTRVHFEKIVVKDEKTGIPQRKIRVCSNKGGSYNVHWAIHSLNFDDVEYQQRQNVFKYCQAEIKELFGNLRRQAKSDIPGAVDYSNWITEAEEAKKEVVADWKQLVKASGIMRGSL